MLESIVEDGNATSNLIEYSGNFLIFFINISEETLVMAVMVAMWRCRGTIPPLGKLSGETRWEMQAGNESRSVT